MVPIFDKVDPVNFSDALIRLSNNHKIEFGNNLLNRYEIQTHKLKVTYGCEVENLTLLKERLLQVAKEKTLIDKKQIEFLADRIGKVIQMINEEYESHIRMN